MKHPLQTTLLGLAICLLLSGSVVSADTAKTTTSQVEYRHYYYSDSLTMYHRFLPSPAPKELRYHTRLKTTANIDDTPEKENIVLIVVDTKRRAPYGNWLQAFLLITDNNANGFPKKKALFKLFDSGTHPLDVSAKPIELHYPPFVFKERLNDAPWKPHGVSFRLIDLTDDGTLDVWVESTYGVALISFQNSAFKEVFSNYTVTRGKLAEAFDVEYHYYRDWFERRERKYHRFLATLPPEGSRYITQMIATANVDDTPEKENIVLILAATKDYPQWAQAFLLITDTQADGFPKKKELFKLFALM